METIKPQPLDVYKGSFYKAAVNELQSAKVPKGKTSRKVSFQPNIISQSLSEPDMRPISPLTRIEAKREFLLQERLLSRANSITSVRTFTKKHDTTDESGATYLQAFEKFREKYLKDGDNVVENEKTKVTMKTISQRLNAYRKHRLFLLIKKLMSN